MHQAEYDFFVLLATAMSPTTLIDIQKNDYKHPAPREESALSKLEDATEHASSVFPEIERQTAPRSRQRPLEMYRQNRRRCGLHNMYPAVVC